jgi:hypothetical protein
MSIPMECGICGRPVEDLEGFMFAWEKLRGVATNPMILCKPIGWSKCWAIQDRLCARLQDVELWSLVSSDLVLRRLDWSRADRQEIIELMEELKGKQ